MGFLSKISSKIVVTPPSDSQQRWRDVFGGLRTNKEEGVRTPPKITPGGSYGSSVVNTDVSTKRLLAAMRSMAPGGWSDDRWEQTLRHYNGVAYVAISNIAKQMGRAKVKVYHKDETSPDGKRIVTRNSIPTRTNVHPYELVELLTRPNKQDSFGKLMYRWTQQRKLTGMSLTWMVPNQFGTPMELYCIPTALAIPQPAVNPLYPDGYYRIQPVYPYGPFSSYPTPTSAVGAAVPAQWMMRFMDPHPLLRYDGYSPLTGLNQHLDSVKMMDASRTTTMRRGVHPSAVLNFDDTEGALPLPEPEIERIKAEFENEQYGPENVGKLFVAAPGSRLESWGFKPTEMDYFNSWEQLVAFVMGGFGITKAVAGMIEDSTYATLYATMKQFALVTLEPECDDIADYLTAHLAPFFGDDLVVEIKPHKVDDEEVRNAKLGLLIQAKAITKNEVRRALEQPATPELWGNEIAGMDSLLPPPGSLPPGMAVAPGMPPDPGMAGDPQPGGLTPDEGGNAIRLDPSQAGMELIGSAPPKQDQGIEDTRPEYMGEGSQGARKPNPKIQKDLEPSNRITEYKKKSFYDRVKEVISNGHG